jgi:hypothetical protein
VTTRTTVLRVSCDRTYPGIIDDVELCIRARNWASRTVEGVSKRYYYPRWQFTNESEDIKGWCGEALDALGIAWRKSNRKTLSVSTREGVRLLDQHIGLKR